MLSVRAENAAKLAGECPFVRVATLLGTHWRPAIVWKIGHGITTYNALRASLDGITDKMLSTGLLGLAGDGLIERIEWSISPRRSTYVLTKRGESLLPVLSAMADWSAEHPV